MQISALWTWETVLADMFLTFVFLLSVSVLSTSSQFRQNMDRGSSMCRTNVSYATLLSHESGGRDKNSELEARVVGDESIVVENAATRWYNLRDR